MTASPYVLLDDSLTPGGRSLLYAEPERVVSATTPEEVEGALDEVSAGLARGLHAAGFFSYELGYCLEPKLKDLLPRDRRVPLFWIGLFRAPLALDDALDPGLARSRMAAPSAPRSRTSRCPGRASNTRKPSTRSRTIIAAGDVYQINLTLKYHFAFEGDPVALYAALRRKQRVAYGAADRRARLQRSVAVA